MTQFYVESLYTNIPNDEGVKIVKGALYTVSKKPVATEGIIKSLLLILPFNFNLTVFNGIYYIQKIGSDVETTCASNYTNIFMGKLKKDTFIHTYTYF